ncbi:hypothetical protein J2Z21_002901 [Streptomyces griseochromogenes]|uniref:Uncharacterized protein n=1 Tax=Streptomyces griseochromogenes TaxID=68214 RepID=A0A1B1AXM9_9ACTN|nr:hypothetical protein AVL59_18415 [Streptomyces griseochromogenes]MBP2049965.1 hypothetical protein [Streptomyces griseochromogenes]
MDHRRQQQARVRITQPLDHQLRQSAQLAVLARLPHGEDHGHRVGRQTPRRERQSLHRRPVQPLGVVHQTHQRLLCGRLRQQRQDRQPHQEPVRHARRAQPERDLQRLPLRARQALQSIQHRRAQLVQPREGEFHFGLHAAYLGDAAPSRPLTRVVQQGRLAHSGLATQDQHRTPARPNPLHQTVQRLALAATTTQPGPGMTDGHRHNRW